MSIKMYLLSSCGKLAKVICSRLQTRTGKRVQKDEKGFSMLELILYAAVVGILVSFAAPKYNNAMASANTARIQSDLQTLDAAIAMYQAETGADPTSITSDLSDYIANVSDVKPPSGKAFQNSDTPSAITATAYDITKANDGTVRATLDSKNASSYGKPAKKATQS